MRSIPAPTPPRARREREKKANEGFWSTDLLIWFFDVWGILKCCIKHLNLETERSYISRQVSREAILSDPSYFHSKLMAWPSAHWGLGIFLLTIILSFNLILGNQSYLTAFTIFASSSGKTSLLAAVLPLVKGFYHYPSHFSVAWSYCSKGHPPHDSFRRQKYL